MEWVGQIGGGKAANAANGVEDSAKWPGAGRVARGRMGMELSGKTGAGREIEENKKDKRWQGG